MHTDLLQFWRIYMRGFGVRDWWRYVCREGFPMWCAWMLPRQVALWVFIRVYTYGCEDCGPDFQPIYDAWVSRRTWKAK